jgi:hypothetical protein
VESFDRNLKVALTVYHNSQHTRWDEHLPSLALEFNTAWHESTAATPALLFLGRDLHHPLKLKWELNELEQEKISKDMEKFWEEALGNLRKASDRVAQRYDTGRRQVELSVNDTVMVRLHPVSSKSERRSAKLDYRWSVPLKIAKFTSPVTVSLANHNTGVIVRKAHVSQLKRYFQAV